MKGIEFAEVRDAIARAFNGDEFDMFLFERLDFDRATNIADGSFKLIVTNVLRQAMNEGWDPILIAEVAAVRPLKQDIQTVYQKYAQGLVDEARQQSVEDKKLKALERFGLSPKVHLQKEGKAQLPAATPYAEGLEKTIKRYLPFLDVGLWRERLFKLEGQVCRVEVGNGDMGTGFLVGPDTLLTNYHVLREVLESRSPADNVRFRFGYRVLANGKESQGVLVSLHPTEWQVNHSEYTDGEAKDKPDETTPTVDQLDYALVKLERSLGNEPVNPGVEGSSARGWVEVPTASQPLTAKMPILILQHPNTEPLKLAVDTEGVLQVNANGTRVRYATNTEGGSSGSPCFDMKWNLIALHHYGDPAQGNPTFNQGVPIVKIRERLKRIGKESALGGPSP